VRWQRTESALTEAQHQAVSLLQVRLVVEMLGLLQDLTLTLMVAVEAPLVQTALALTGEMQTEQPPALAAEVAEQMEEVPEQMLLQPV
jgi:hypothetical protein